MMRFSTILLLLNLAYLTVKGQETNQEPILNLDITVNGVSYQIQDGDTLNLPNTQIIVKSSDYLTFDFGILNFEYPKYFSFTYEQDVAYQNWTLDGNDFIIMYFEIDSEIELDTFIEEIVNRFGKKNCSIKKKTLKMGDLTLKGKRINVELLGQKLTYDMFKLETENSKSHFVAFQDSKKDDGADSEESIEALSIINKTISLK